MISIIIVNWNTGKLLLRCLESLAALPEKALINRVIVIDNASDDDSVEEAKKITPSPSEGEGGGGVNFSTATPPLISPFARGRQATDLPVQFIKLTENSGFAHANNVGLKEIEKDPTHVLLLNPDTEVQPGALRAMLDFLESHPKAGIVGPRLLNADDRQTQPSVRSFPTLLVFMWLFLKLHRLFAGVPFWKQYMRTDFDYDKAAPVDQVMGAAFLIRDKAVEKLDERFWIWFEEVDFCKRTKAKGWDVWYAPSGEIMHHGAASFNQLVGFKRSWPFLRSSLHYSAKHLGIVATSILIIFLPIALVLILAATLMHLKSKSHYD